MNREDFPMLDNDIIYFDNGATTLKPKSVIDKTLEYYTKYSANAHRGDYDISYIVDEEYESTRTLVKEFINANAIEEVIFTSGTTESLNMIARGFFKPLLESGDEILLTETEHASNVLPWFVLANENNCQIKYIPLNEENKVTMENLISVITPKTKVISLAYITNVIGDVRPIKDIIAYAHQHNIFVVVDGAQAVPHMKVDVKELDVDFLAFSAHKMCGPTGVGVLYGKQELLEELHPINLGGGMNESFDSKEEIVLKELPGRLEAGTPNIAGVIAFKESIKYLNKIGMDKIREYENNLRKYLVDKMMLIPYLDIININSDSGIVTFNIDGLFPQDVAYYLNKYKICVRAGNHCAKLTKNKTGVKNTIRISLYFYNNYEEIDNFIELISDRNKIEKEMI